MTRRELKRAAKRYAKALLLAVLEVADWIIDAITTILLIIGAGAFAGFGVGAGLAVAYVFAPDIVHMVLHLII